jgi:putative phosphoesterase
MRIALIGDIHANLPALEAVLSHADQNWVESVWNLGDSVGLGAFPAEVLKLLKKDDIFSIAGNQDLSVLKVAKKSEDWFIAKNPKMWATFSWTYRQLSKKNIRFLKLLPRAARVKAKGWRILLTHGSPASHKEHLNPDTPEAHLKELAAMTKAKIILCGHSHTPFMRNVDETWFINPGSVGMSVDGDTQASYAVLDIQRDDIKVVFHRVPYDVERAVTAMRAAGLPESYAQMVLQARSLEWLDHPTVPCEEIA